MNPYYHSEQLGWEIVSLDDQNQRWSYSKICFWRTKKGLIYGAYDSCCSCPAPYETYDFETAEEIEQKLERIGTLDQALGMIKTFKKNACIDPASLATARKTLREWFKSTQQ